MTEVAVIERVNSEIQTSVKQGANVLGNVTLFKEVPFGHRPTIESVQLSANPDDRDVYKQQGGGLSLTAQALKKFANALNVRWLGGQVLPTSTEECLQYRAIASCKSLDGTWRQVERDYELDLTVRSEEMYVRYEEKARYFFSNKPKAPVDFRAQTKEEAIDWAKEKTRIDMIQIRKHKLSRAQTGAQLRCIRDLAQVKAVYTPQELSKPFVVLKLVFQADPTNPIDRQFLLNQAVGATEALYPPAAQQPVPQLTADPKAPPGDPRAFNPVEPTEGELLAEGIEPTFPPVQEEKTPSPYESAIMDFEACDTQEKINTIVSVMGRKKWEGRLEKPLEEFSDTERLEFFKFLLRIPEPVKPASQPWS